MEFIENLIKTDCDYKDFKDNVGKTVSFKGMIHRIRKMTGFSFVIIRTARELVQAIASAEETQDFDKDELAEGQSVILTGKIVKDNSRDDRYELHISEYKILSSPAEMLPIVINKKELNIPIDLNLNLRPLALRHIKERAVFKISDGIERGFRDYLASVGFTEINAPKIVAAGAEGGADMFELDYFGKRAFLSQSPQMYKQMMVGVFERVFTIGSVFRAEKHNTSRHINEFTGLDFEMGFIDSFKDVMSVEMEMLKYVFKFLTDNYSQELADLKVTLPVFDHIPCVKFVDAKKMVEQKYNRKFRDINDLEPEEEKLIGKLFKEEYGSDLVFVTHYPSAKRPFYAMDDPQDPQYTLSFDLLLNGSEITTGGQRIHDYKMQVDKMLARGMNPDLFESYLMIHKYGIPPHGGLGLGLERLTMKLLNLDNIRQATLFPRDQERLEP